MSGSLAQRLGRWDQGTARPPSCAVPDRTWADQRLQPPKRRKVRRAYWGRIASPFDAPVPVNAAGRVYGEPALPRFIWRPLPRETQPAGFLLRRVIEVRSRVQEVRAPLDAARTGLRLSTSHTADQRPRPLGSPLGPCGRCSWQGRRSGTRVRIIQMLAILCTHVVARRWPCSRLRTSTPTALRLHERAWTPQRAHSGDRLPSRPS